MFESFKSVKSIAVYLIFGLLILVFVISFGPQSGQTGCSPSTATAAKVNGKAISDNTWRYGILAVSGGAGVSGESARRRKLRESVLDSLIVRELLAQAGEELGFRVSDEEVRQRLVVNGELLILGEKIDGKRVYYVADEEGGTPRFRAQALDSFVKGRLGLSSVERFIDEAKKEILAQKVRDLLAASVRVSPEEVQHQYTLDASKVDIEYVAFQTPGYRSALEPSAEEIDAHLKAKEADLKAQFEKEADRWKGRDEVRVRHLFVKSEKPAAPPPAPGAPPAPPPAADKPDPAKAKADAALAQIKAGKDFATVARGTNPDIKRGGDLGWRPLRGLRLGPNVAEAVGKLEKGQTTEVIEAPDGFHIVQLTDKRAGDLTFDQVKRDLAEAALLDEKAKAAAKADADKALAAAKAGTPLDKQFPAAAEGEPPAAPGAKPRLQKGTEIKRLGGYVAGIGTSKELITELFDKLSPGDLASQVYEVGGDFFVVRLTKRDEPDMAKFQTEKPKIAAELTRRKAVDAVAAYQSRRCREVAERGGISYNEALVTYNESDTNVTPKPTYVPCQTLR